MSTTQKELKQLIETGEKELQSLMSDFSENKEWSDLKQEQDSLEKRLLEIKSKRRSLEHVLYQEREDAIKLKRDDINYAYQMLRSKEMGLNPKDYNQDLQKMFKAFYAGSTWDQEKRLFWVSEDGKFAIFKKRAYQAYINRGQTSYSEAFWCLFPITDKCKEYDGSSTTRLESNSNLCIWKTEGGRWNKARMEEAENAIKDYLNKKKQNGEDKI
jgi:hypothetical protein